MGDTVNRLSQQDSPQDQWVKLGEQQQSNLVESFVLRRLGLRSATVGVVGSEVKGSTSLWDGL